MIRRAALAAAVILGAAACQSPSTEPDAVGSDGLITPDKEREITAGVAAQIRAQAPFVTDAVVLAYINDLGQHLVLATEPQPFVYRFAIIDDDSLNAFTIGGGYVYLNKGVIAQAGDVSELAGVMSHEIAHVRMRHMARRSEGQGLSTLVTLAGVAALVLSGGDPSLLIASQGVNVALQLRNSRAAEAEADTEGVDYMIRSGYDPDGMVRFFERISNAHPNAGDDIPAYLFSHPAVKERVRTTRLLIERESPPADLIRADERLPQIQERLATLGARVVGGSGLHARATFDRTVSDPLLARARAAYDDGAPGEARRVLLLAAEREPGDPRIWLRLADLSEEEDDMEQTAYYLQRAFELDDDVPLVQYRLGVVHRRLGNRTLAVFYLEQAAQNFRPGSTGRRKAELEVRQMSVPALRESLVSTSGAAVDAATFRRGDVLNWWGDLNEVFIGPGMVIRVTWLDPNGEAALDEFVPMDPFGEVESAFDTKDAALGGWSVVVRLADSTIDRKDFSLVGEPVAR
ncbi:MAG: M48 family metalloprotease [Deltaproteobacteria bacterium]|nr:M48 family metalloprotease [Deltaproteobacteria bacterium]